MDDGVGKLLGDLGMLTAILRGLRLRARKGSGLLFQEALLFGDETQLLGVLGVEVRHVFGVAAFQEWPFHHADETAHAGVHSLGAAHGQRLQHRPSLLAHPPRQQRGHRPREHRGENEGREQKQQDQHDGQSPAEELMQGRIERRPKPATPAQLHRADALAQGKFSDAKGAQRRPHPQGQGHPGQPWRCPSQPVCLLIIRGWNPAFPEDVEGHQPGADPRQGHEKPRHGRAQGTAEIVERLPDVARRKRHRVRGVVAEKRQQHDQRERRCHRFRQDPAQSLQTRSREYGLSVSEAQEWSRA